MEAFSFIFQPNNSHVPILNFLLFQLLYYIYTSEFPISISWCIKLRRSEEPFQNRNFRSPYRGERVGFWKK